MHVAVSGCENILRGGGNRLGFSAQSKALSELRIESVGSFIFARVRSYFGRRIFAAPLDSFVAVSDRAACLFSFEKSNTSLRASFAGLSGVFPHACRAIGAGR